MLGKSDSEKETREIGHIKKLYKFLELYLLGIILEFFKKK